MLSQLGFPVLQSVFKSRFSIDAADPFFLGALFFAFFNPFVWNVLGRLEYNTRALTRAFGGHKRMACYAFAAAIFGLGAVRDFVFKAAVDGQSQSPQLQGLPFLDPIVYLFFAAGAVLVGSSMLRLGVIGTYHGDHFGILMKKRITSFPFNVVEHPMYYGSTLNFFGYALMNRSMAGVFIASTVALFYFIASKYEEKFTARIYSKASRAAVSKKRF